MCTAERLREQDGLINWVKTTCWGLLLATLVYFPPISYAQMKIYSNGPLSTGPITEDGTAAPAGYTWSEVQHDAGNTNEANTQAGISQLNGSQALADDFTVPPDQIWTISSIVFYAYKTNAPSTPSPFVAYYLKVWNGPPGNINSTLLCGDSTTNVLLTSTDAGMYRIFNSVVPTPIAPTTTRKIWKNTVAIPAGCNSLSFFASGSYWLEWSVKDTSNTNSHFQPLATILGARSKAGANARRFTNSTNVWEDVVDTGNPATAPDVKQDLPFKIYGTSSDIIFNDDFGGE